MILKDEDNYAKTKILNAIMDYPEIVVLLKERYVDEKLIASGTQEEILSIMRLMTQHEVLEKASNDNGRETKEDKSNC